MPVNPVDDPQIVGHLQIKMALAPEKIPDPVLRARAAEIEQLTGEPWFCVVAPLVQWGLSQLPAYLPRKWYYSWGMKIVNKIFDQIRENNCAE